MKNGRTEEQIEFSRDTRVIFKRKVAEKKTLFSYNVVGDPDYRRQVAGIRMKILRSKLGLEQSSPSPKMQRVKYEGGKFFNLFIFSLLYLNTMMRPTMRITWRRRDECDSCL